MGWIIEAELGLTFLNSGGFLGQCIKAWFMNLLVAMIWTKPGVKEQPYNWKKPEDVNIAFHERPKLGSTRTYSFCISWKDLRYYIEWSLMWYVVVLSVGFREWRHCGGPSGLLFTAQRKGGHQTNQPREVPDQYGRAPGKTHNTAK